MDLSTFIVAVFCLIDDRLKGKRIRQRGPSPKLSDAELITIEIVGEFLGLDTDQTVSEGESSELRPNGVLRSSPINNRKLVLLRDAGPLRKEYGVVVTWQTDRCVVGRRTATCPPSRPGPATSPTSIQRALSIPFKGRI